MNLQPGVGYTFTGSQSSATLVIDEPWVYLQPPRPFTVYCFKDGSDYKVKVIPGTVNNVEPTMGGTPLSNNPAPTMNIGYSASPANEYIYVTVPDGTPFPTSPIVMHDASPQTSDDTTGYLLLAIVDISNGKVTQYVGGSQWCERFKCGTDTAEYFFSVI